MTICTEDEIRDLIGFAARAPSGHNTQPWKFRIGRDSVDVVADRTRALPVVDPFDRELTISCGAAIAFLEVAARERSLECQTVDHPEQGKVDHLAQVAFEKGRPASERDMALFNAIQNRCTDRTAYSMEPITGDVVNTCCDLAREFGIEIRFIETDQDRSNVAALVAEGDRVQFEDPRFRRELASWVHSAGLGSRDGMSGAAFGMPDLLSPVGRFVIRTFDIGNGVAAADEKKIVSASPVLAIFGSAKDNEYDWLNTGRALANVLLFLTSRGLAASYLNQPIETDHLRPKHENMLKHDRASASFAEDRTFKR